MRASEISSQFTAIVAAPFGAVGIRTAAGLVQELVYLPKHFQPKAPTDALAAKVAHQVQRYLTRPATRFSLPLAEIGSPFQRRVWAAIATIPCGQVRTYGQIAKLIQSAPRAVGQACGANWLPLVIPCHRVIAASGLGGFSQHDDEDGFHLGVKRWLLAHEGVHGY